jgi:hypothetical protein
MFLSPLSLVSDPEESLFPGRSMEVSELGARL